MELQFVAPAILAESHVDENVLSLQRTDAEALGEEKLQRARKNDEIITHYLNEGLKTAIDIQAKESVKGKAMMIAIAKTQDFVQSLDIRKQILEETIKMHEMNILSTKTTKSQLDQQQQNLKNIINVCKDRYKRFKDVCNNSQLDNELLKKQIIIQQEIMQKIDCDNIKNMLDEIESIKEEIAFEIVTIEENKLSKSKQEDSLRADIKEWENNLEEFIAKKEKLINTKNNILDVVKKECADLTNFKNDLEELSNFSEFIQEKEKLKSEISSQIERVNHLQIEVEVLNEHVENKSSENDIITNNINGLKKKLEELKKVKNKEHLNECKELFENMKKEINRDYETVKPTINNFHNKTISVKNKINRFVEERKKLEKCIKVLSEKNNAKMIELEKSKLAQVYEMKALKGLNDIKEMHEKIVAELTNKLEELTFEISDKNVGLCKISEELEKNNENLRKDISIENEKLVEKKIAVQVAIENAIKKFEDEKTALKNEMLEEDKKRMFYIRNLYNSLEEKNKEKDALKSENQVYATKIANKQEYIRNMNKIYQRKSNERQIVKRLQLLEKTIEEDNKKQAENQNEVEDEKLKDISNSQNNNSSSIPIPGILKSPGSRSHVGEKRVSFHATIPHEKTFFPAKKQKMEAISDLFDQLLKEKEKI